MMHLINFVLAALVIAQGAAAPVNPSGVPSGAPTGLPSGAPTGFPSGAQRIPIRCTLWLPRGPCPLRRTPRVPVWCTVWLRQTVGCPIWCPTPAALRRAHWVPIWCSLRLPVGSRPFGPCSFWPLFLRDSHPMCAVRFRPAGAPLVPRLASFTLRGRGRLVLVPRPLACPADSPLAPPSGLARPSGAPSGVPHPPPSGVPSGFPSGLAPSGPPPSGIPSNARRQVPPSGRPSGAPSRLPRPSGVPSGVPPPPPSGPTQRRPLGSSLRRTPLLHLVPLLPASPLIVRPGPRVPGLVLRRRPVGSNPVLPPPPALPRRFWPEANTRHRVATLLSI
ncbi:hypothetical protein LXA43DRAFT_1107373 [Ganoderma leucocontextum]|nr:hypothetical protein LXA43DRAFT_1107373 [Ganoderma leucocontextum]